MRFLMVDRILSIEPGKNIVAVKTLDPSEELFQDHFPGFPVVPGVLLTEMMAQTAGNCLFSEAPERGYPMLLRIKNASFRTWVEPGHEIRLHAEVTSSAPTYAGAKCQAQVSGQKVCEAELAFCFVPRERLGAPSESLKMFSIEAHDHDE